MNFCLTLRLMTFCLFLCYLRLNMIDFLQKNSNERVDHAHTWSGTKGREGGRELYPKERREFNRAKRKRRVRK